MQTTWLHLNINHLIWFWTKTLRPFFDLSSRSYNTLQAQITEQALNIKTLTTVYGIRQIQYIDQLKKNFFYLYVLENQGDVLQ